MITIRELHYGVPTGKEWELPKNLCELWQHITDYKIHDYESHLVSYNVKIRENEFDIFLLFKDSARVHLTTDRFLITDSEWVEKERVKEMIAEILVELRREIFNKRTFDAEKQDKLYSILSKYEISLIENK